MALYIMSIDFAFGRIERLMVLTVLYAICETVFPARHVELFQMCLKILEASARSSLSVEADKALRGWNSTLYLGALKCPINLFGRGQTPPKHERLDCEFGNCRFRSLSNTHD